MNAARSRKLGAIVACMIAIMVVCAASVAAAAPPHVPTQQDTDSCAMCHRNHSPASDAQRTQFGSDEMTGSALLLGMALGEQERPMCYSCHGVDMLGSMIDVQGPFEDNASSHPEGSGTAFGPTVITCSTCHDSHGTQRMLSGDPYPGLLRRLSPTDPTQTINSGDEYCATCHVIRPNSMWSGLPIWDQTAHSRLITISPTGSGIVCQACHVPHGSPIAPLVRETLVPPSVLATYTVTGNDRRLCLGCHAEAKDVYAGQTVYATSTHAASLETVPVAAEWAKNDESMRVGECDVCHNPMGDTDPGGAVIPKLVRRQESDLCLPCHDGSKGGLDIAQFEFPAAESSRAEIAMVWDPERIPEVFSSLSAFAAETTGTVPRALFGPREWPIEAATGNAAFGNIDGIGTSELVVADIENDRLMVFRRDAMNGLARTVITLPAGVKPSFIAIEDYVDDLSLRPEIAIVSRDVVSPFASVLRLLRYNSGTSAYDVVDGPYAVGDDVTGIASGDVTGTALPDLVITSAGSQALRIATKSILGPTEIVVSPAYATRAGPRGPSVGDAISAHAGTEIVVANSGVTANTISVFDGSGQELDSYNATAAAGASAWYSLVADVIPEAQSAGAETVIAMRHPTGMSSILVYGRAAGLTGPARHDTGTKYNTASLAFGDVDYDGSDELVAGNAGYWGFGVAGVLGVAPNVQAISFGESGAGSVASQTVRAGGAELAGGQPSLVVADFGPIGHSGHPTDGATGAHVSTETAGFQQHAECVDCHNPHAEQVTTSYSPPLAPATNRGAWGVKHSVVGTAPLSFTLLKGVTYEYELCFKCHSSWTQPANSWLDIASECDTRNASFHGIMSGSTNASVPLESFVATTPALTNSTVMLCTTCHANSDSAKPRGPHDSEWAPMLAAPYSGVASTDTSLLCYRCHKYDVYVTGSAPTTYTLFYDPALAEPQLHKLHVGQRGFTCIACHTNHGSDGAHLVRPGLDWFAYPDGGACYTECHPGGGLANVYSRVIVAPPSSVSTPTAFSITTGTIVSGNLASLIATDGDVLDVATSGGTTAMDLRLTFGGIATPPRFINIYGSYSGQHSLSIALYNFTTSTYDEVGVMPRNTTNLWSYPVISGTPYVSGAEVRIRFLDNKKSFPLPGNLILDRVWISH